MVEGLTAESLTHRRTARDNSHFRLVIGLTQKTRHQLRGSRREFRWLDHRAVARREDACEGRPGEVDREIPRADDAHRAERLILNAGLRAKQTQRELDLALFRLHPLAQMLLRMLERAEGAHHIRQQRLLMAAMAEIGGK